MRLRCPVTSEDSKTPREIIARLCAGFVAHHWDQLLPEWRERHLEQADVILEDLQAAGFVLCKEQKGWWNERRGVHPIQMTAADPVHEFECYTTDKGVYIPWEQKQ